MIAVHLIHVAIFGFATTRPEATPPELRALHYLVIIHGAMVPITAGLIAMVVRVRRPERAALIGPLVATIYLAHGAVCTACNLITVPSLTTYVGYCLSLAVVLYLPPRPALVAYSVGLIALVASLVAIVPSPAIFVATMPTCVSITAVCVGLVAVLHAGRRRDFRQRLTIKRQRDELERLNAELERRVHSQVGEIVARAGEVDQLNAQLQAQVRARSDELSLALARLAQQRHPAGAVLRGTVLGGRFVVGDVIGEGGMGAVYAGTDRATGARVALKVVQATSTRTLEALRRFAREAGTAAAITHPAVVRMIDVDISDDGLLFQAQELIDGVPLSRQLQGAWSPADAARLGAVLCDALAAAHAAAVIHRDVKPENVMLTASAPGLKLLDFGIAKLHAAVQGHGRGDGTDTMTRTGMVVGTPAYMAPEQALGTAVTDRADVYAVGAILFRLLTERPPFEAESARALVAVRALHDPPRVRAFQPTVPASLAELVDGCLVRPAADRPSAAELAPRLAAWADAAGAPALEFAARRACDAIATASSNHRAVPMC
jgi:serine/threonine-protein kinase